MKKILVPILIMIILFNFIFANYSMCADAEGIYSEDNFNQSNDDGTTQDPNNKKTGVNAGMGTSVSGAIVGILAALLDVIPMLANQFMNYFVSQGGYVNFNTTIDGIDDKDFHWITIEKIVFGNYYMFNVDLIRDSSSLNVSNKDGGTPPDLAKTINDLRDKVAEWYYILRLISVALGLVTLIYVGIRMALSTVASDQAKYKKMLISWVQSIAIIAFLPYIMVLLNFVAKVLMNIITNLKSVMVASGEKSFETEIITSIYEEFGQRRRNDFSSIFNCFLVINFC